MNWNGDKNKIILVGLVVFFMACFMAMLILRPGDDKVFIFFSGLITGVMSAMTRDMKSEPSAPPPGTTTKSASSVEQKTETPASPPPVVPPVA
jgi:hypothetical protein